MGNASATVTESSRDDLSESRCDRDDLMWAVIRARLDVFHKRAIGDGHRELAQILVPGVFGDVLDVLHEACVSTVIKTAPEAFPEGSLDDWPDDTSNAIWDAIFEAFWQGLTSAHVALGGDVGVPYRLFAGPRQ